MQFIFTKLGSTLLVIALIAFGYFLFTAIGDTTIGVTLKTNPALEDGLVGHWTFDGKDTTGGGGSWYDAGYGYKRALTITAGGTSGGVATTTTNGYAVLATTTLSTLMATSSGGKIEKLDANNNLPYDIIFVDSDDTTLLDFEIESYASTTGALVAWVEVESISSTTAQTFNMYYGNAVATDKSNATGVWNSTYAGVWHLPEDPSGTAPQMLDSTANNNDGTSAGTMTTSDQVAGQVDGSLDFDGSNDYVNNGSSSTLAPATFTVSGWAKPDIGDTSSRAIAGKIDTGKKGFSLRKDAWGGSAYKFAMLTGNGSAWSFTYEDSSRTDTNWHFIVGQYDGTKTMMYVDGIKQSDEDTLTISHSTGNFLIASLYNNSVGSFFDGLLDDVRIYNTVLHPMDILTDYNMSVDNTTFLSWGAETAFAGGSATDVSGQGNNGTINLLNKALGKIGQAYSFNGISDFVDIGAGPTSVKSVAFWVYPDTTTEYFVNLTGTSDYIWVNGGTVTATGLTSPTIYVDGIVSSALSANQWQHVVVTTATAENASNLDIGRTQDANYMQGRIDDARLYSKELSLGEIKRLYEMGGTTHVNVTLKTNPTLEDGLVGHWTFDGKDMYNNVADVSGQGNTGYLTLGASGNISTTTAIGVIGQGLDFDGTDDYVDVGTSAIIGGGTSWTIGAWVKTSQVGNPGIYVESENTGTEDFIMLVLYNNKGRFIFRDSSDVIYILDGTSTVADGNWHLLTTTRNGNDFIFYVDGVEENSNTFAVTTFIINHTIIGAQWNEGVPTSFFDGLIDEVRVYNRTMSVEEIKRLYDMGK
jgi:hypothetical protein